MSDDLTFDPFWVAEDVSEPAAKPREESQSTPSSLSADHVERAQPRSRTPVSRPSRARRNRESAAPFETTLLAKVRQVATRLNDAGHRAVVDERIGRRPAGARLLVEPRRGPLQPAAESTVLELTLEAGRLGARVWIDLVGPTPEVLHPLPGEDQEIWLDRVLLDFVARALARA